MEYNDGERKSSFGVPSICTKIQTLDVKRSLGVRGAIFDDVSWV